LWCLLDYKATTPETTEPPYDVIFFFSPTDYYPAKPVPRFWAVKKGQEVLYELHKAGSKLGGDEYIDPKTNRPWRRETAEGLTEAIILEEDGQKVRYNLVKPAGGKFQQGESARYAREGGGQGWTEEEVARGQTSRFHLGLFVANILINVIHLGLWFAGMWLLLRYQWAHALLLAVIFWLVMTFAARPMLLTRAVAAAQPQAPARTAAAPDPAHGAGLTSAA